MAFGLRPLSSAAGRDNNSAAARCARSTDVVVRVMDSDRVKLERAGVVRLAGVRTPTRDVPVCYNREPGVKTRGMLSRGAKVEVELSSGDANIVVGGKSVSETLVREGFAYATPRRRRASDGDDYLGSALADAQAAAKRDQRGLWRPTVTPAGGTGSDLRDIDFQPTPTSCAMHRPNTGLAPSSSFMKDALAIFERAPD